MSASTGPRLAARDPLRSLIAGRVAERFTDELAMLGFPVIATVTLSASAGWIGAITAGLFAAPMIVALPAGLWADRFSPRRLMIAGAAARMAALACLTGAWSLGWLSTWWLLAAALASGAAATVYQVSSASAVPAMVPEGTLRISNSRIDAGGYIASVAGPLLGGTIARVLAPPLILLAGAVSMAATTFTAWRLPEPRRVVHHERPSIAAGLRYVWSEPLQRRILLRGATANLGMLMIVALYSVAVIREMGYDTLTLGVVLAVSGAGGIVGAGAGPALARRFGEGGVVPVTALVAGIGALGYPAALMLDRPWSLPAMLIADLVTFTASTAYAVAQRTLRQELCPPHLQGRMNASMHFAQLATAPFGALAGGAIASAASVTVAFWVGGSIVCASSAIVVFSPLWGMRTLPANPLEGATAHPEHSPW